jgi:hypothetical protein
MRTPMKLTLSEEDRATLTRWVKSRAVGEKQKRRARMVLMTADGAATQTILDTLDVSAPTLNLCAAAIRAMVLRG